MKNLDFSIDIHTAESTDVQIERQIRRLINEGALVPGQRLPSFAEMARTFRVSTVSLNRAISRLAAEGLIERRQRRGSFVCERRVLNVAVVTGATLSEEPSHFARRLIDCLRLEGMRYGWECRIYDGIRSPRLNGKGSPNRLRTDLSHFAFSGVIDLNGVFREKELAIADRKPLPVVHWGVESPRPDVVIDYRRFTAESIGYLAGQGLRRFAYVRSFGSLDKENCDLRGVEEAESRYGLEKVEVIPLESFRTALEFEQASFGKIQEAIARWRRRRRWPQALILSDDIATRGAALGLIKEQVRVPQRLRVLTLANEGIHFHYGIPVSRYELNLPGIASQLLGLLLRRNPDRETAETPVRISGRLVP